MKQYGENWLICGEVDFSAENSIQIGIHAIGNAGPIRGGDRVVAPEYGRTATAMRFDYFRILR